MGKSCHGRLYRSRINLRRESEVVDDEEDEVNDDEEEDDALETVRVLGVEELALLMSIESCRSMIGGESKRRRSCWN